MPDTQTISSQTDTLFNPKVFLDALACAAGTGTPATLGVDLRAQCRDCLTDAQGEASGLSQSQTDQVIDALWSLCLAMVDLAYRSKPVDQALAARRASSLPCGKLSAQSAAACDSERGAVLSSAYPETKRNDKVCAASHRASGKGASCQ